MTAIIFRQVGITYSAKKLDYTEFNSQLIGGTFPDTLHNGFMPLGTERSGDLEVDHYICTEVETVDGRLTGRTVGILNMRMGKVDRLRQWLIEQQQPERLLSRASFYSDSINDLALLSVVGRPVVVDPDPRLESAALRNGWSVLRFNRSA
jgi:phosphoserine phosphatase